MMRFLDNFLRDLIIRIGSVYVRLSKVNRLSDALHSTERALSLNRAAVQLVETLADRKIRVLDIGARGGPMDYLRAYNQQVEFSLCEPEPEEAARLRGQGFNTLDHVIDEHSGEVILNITREPGNSSLLEPGGSIQSFYSDNSDRFDIINRIKLQAWSLADAATHIGGSPDLLKMDAQGAELRILRGMGKAKPIFVISEFLTAELYKGHVTLFDIGQFLYQSGYIVFDMPTKRVRPAAVELSRPRNVRASLGLPMLGDAYFMPDWTRPEGRSLIEGREKVWAALMIMHGLEDVLRYVLDLGIVDRSDEILELLNR